MRHRRTTFERSRGSYPAPGLFVVNITLLAVLVSAGLWLYIRWWLG